MVDRRGADDGIVDLELADEVDRRLAHHAAVLMPHDAAGNNDFDLLITLQNIGYIDIICDHQ